MCGSQKYIYQVCKEHLPQKKTNLGQKMSGNIYVYVA